MVNVNEIATAIDIPFQLLMENDASYFIDMARDMS
jgi:hypothetical protein